MDDESLFCVLWHSEHYVQRVMGNGVGNLPGDMTKIVAFVSAMIPRYIGRITNE